MNEGYKRLEENISDMMAEEQAKLGYMKEEVRLYYPLSSLCNILECKTDINGMNDVLAGFPSYMEEKYGKIMVSNKGERFCILMPEKAAEYIHSNKKESDLIYRLIELVSKHDTSMEQIIELFKEQKDECVVEKVNGEDFDILIRFVDSKDKYYYCFKDEGAHIIYHRFLPEDYMEMFAV